MSRLVTIRLPTPSERREGAHIVFVRSRRRRCETIFAHLGLSGWHQWGASYFTLCDNWELVERWARGDLIDFPPPRIAEGRP